MTASSEGPPQVEVLSQASLAPFSQEWYEISSADHFWFEWRFRAARRQLADLRLSPERPARVLDIGSGNGILRGQLETATAWTVDCAELNREALLRCGKGRGRLLAYDILEQREELRAAYDVVLLFDVIEHLAEVRPFLKASLAHLKPGGHLLINVPALQSCYSDYDRAVGHFRRYDKRSLASELSGLPLEIRDRRYWGLLMLPLLAARRFPGLPRSGADVVRRGMAPPSEAFNRILKLVARGETAVCRRPWLGTSLLLAAARRD